MKRLFKNLWRVLSPTYRKLEWLEHRIDSLHGAFSHTFEGQSEKLYHELRKCEINERLLAQEEGNDLIRLRLLEGRPFMAGRLGGVEAIAMYYYHLYDWRHWREEYSAPKLESLKVLESSAGFFPPDPQLMRRFCRIYVEAMKEFDFAALWNFTEKTVRAEAEIILHQRYFPNAVTSFLFSISSYLYEHPWSAVLQGKRVLVVHPFEKSIRQQYEVNRANIFPGRNVLPEFGSLDIVRAVQSIQGNKPAEFETWFDALEHMKQEVSRREFDVALIGAGAYGLPLAAHVKRMGKSAIHMGGELQMLFGVKGRRWTVEQKQGRAKFINEHWVSPLQEERPPGWESMEGGCYW